MPAAGGPCQEHRPSCQPRGLFVSTQDTNHVPGDRLQPSADGKPASILRGFSPQNLRLAPPRDPGHREARRLEVSEWLAHLRALPFVRCDLHRRLGLTRPACVCTVTLSLHLGP